MLQSGESVRFTPNEVEEFRRIGLDSAGAKTTDELEAEIATSAYRLAEERPDLLERIAVELAEAKGKKPSPKLSAIPSSDSLRRP